MNRHGGHQDLRRLGSRARALQPDLRRRSCRSRKATASPKGTMLAEWDPYAIPILTEVDGVVKYGDIIDGVTMEEKLDEVTGLSRRVIIESRDPQRASARVDQGSEHAARPRSCVERARRRATSCRSARTSSRRRVRPWKPARSSPRFRARPRRPRTSPAVCRASPSCSRRASRRTTRSSPTSTAS